MAWKFLMINLYTVHTSPNAYMGALVTSSTLVIQMRELIKVRLRYTNAGAGHRYANLHKYDNLYRNLKKCLVLLLVVNIKSRETEL